jgi:pSer/pThr/pTyr-binding forkhead associated (FHA) protein
MNDAVLEVSQVGGAAETKSMAPGIWLIGRESGDLVIGDRLVSSRHGQLQLTQGVLTYTDLGSTNGSFLGANPQRLSGPTMLKPGDVIRVGDSSITVKSLPEPQPASVTATLSGAMSAATPALSAGRAVAPVRDLTEPAAPVQAPPTPLVEAPAAAAYRPVAGLPRGAAVNADSAGTADTEAFFSNPTNPVRHSYPLAINDAGFGTALGLLMKSMPYALMRFAILLGCSVLSIIWAIFTFGGAAFLGSKVSLIGWIWALIGIGLFGGFWRIVLRYFLYLLKAGHIAVLTELITTNEVAHGHKGMFQYGIDTVKSRFGQVNAMFALDMLIEAIVRAFNRSLDWIAGLIPIPGLSSVAAVVNRIIYAATTYVDETIFSYNLARGDQNVWRSSKDAIIYYAQNSKEVLKTGLWIVILDYVLTGVTWLVMLLPAFIVTIMLPDSLGGWTAVFMIGTAVLFASNFRGAFLAPLFLTMIMIKFHVSVQNQAIDEVWDGRLSDLSDKFRELKDKAYGAESSPASSASHPTY